MLGFLPLCTEPLSSVVSEINRLESSSQLDSLSIINGSLFGKFFFDTPLEVITSSSFASKITLQNALTINSQGQLEQVEKIVVPLSSSFNTDAELTLNVLNKIHSAKTISAFSTFLPDSYLKNILASNLNNFSSFDSLSIVKNYNTVHYSTNAELFSFEKIVVDLSSNINEETFISFSPSFKIISDAIYSVNSEFNASYRVESFISASFDIKSEFTGTLGALYALDSNLEIVGVFSSNLSQRNRDIVYYILAIDKTKPFELKILRAK